MHGLESHESFYFIFFPYEFIQHNSYNPICTVQIVYKLKRTNSLVFVRIRIKSYIVYTNCIVRIHTKFLFFVFSKSVQTSRERAARAARAKLELRARSASHERAARAARAKPKLRARSASREGEARAASAQREPRGRSPSTPPAPTRPHPAAPTIRVHPAAPTN